MYRVHLVSVSGCILLVYRDVCRPTGCVSGMFSQYREGSIIVADMLYLADGYLREGSSDSIYIPLRDHCNHHNKQNVMSLAYANNKMSSAVLFYYLYALI